MYSKNLQQTPIDISKINLDSYMFFITNCNLLERHTSLISSMFSNSFETKIIDNEMIEFSMVIDDKKILIKNGLKFIGLSYIEAKDPEIFLYKCSQVFHVLDANNINYRFVSSPSGCAGQLIIKHTDSLKISKIHIHLPIYSVRQFCSKYFLILKNYFRLSYTPEMHAIYNEFIQYDYIPSSQELFCFYKEKKIYDLDLLKTLKKVVKERGYFEECQHYLQTNKILFTRGEDFILKTAFLGARIEVLANIKNVDEDKRVVEVDMPGAYYSTLRHIFPIGTVNLEEYPKDCKIIEDEFYECVVNYISNELPVLPLKYKGGLIFPVGDFKGVWRGEELLLFIEQGGVIKKIEKRFFWEKYEPCFNKLCDVIDNFKDKEFRWYLKKVKTNIFGNFAKKEKTSSMITVENGAVNSQTHVLKYNTNYFIASIITSKIRVYMYRLYLVLKKEKTLVLSINTDSITMYLSLNEFNEISKKYPQYELIWNKKKIYKEILYINNKHVIITNESDNQILDSYGNSYSSLEYIKIRKKFHSYNHDTYSINNKKFFFSSYDKRIWNVKRYSTSPIYVTL